MALWEGNATGLNTKLDGKAGTKGLETNGRRKKLP